MAGKLEEESPRLGVQVRTALTALQEVTLVSHSRSCFLSQDKALHFVVTKVT